MCGIAGRFYVTPESKEDSESLIRAMTATLEHRGPDDSGCWTDTDAGISLGFRRLAIIDLSEAGHQPMVSGSGRYVMVFNGEIYNFSEIRRSLPDDIEWRGHSDSEVFLAALDKWGLEETLDRCIGMFAIAIWDRKDRTLSLVRDRLGIKPLFVFSDGKQLLFASELKAILKALPAPPDIDRDALAQYLRYMYVPAPGCIFKNISKLLPGHVLTIPAADGTSLPSKAFWSLRSLVSGGSSSGTKLSEKESLDDLEATLTDAVRLRSFADVPVGAFLSGGIDSSLVVAMMQAHASQPVKTFTIAFDDKQHDESASASRVADHLGTNHSTIPVAAGEAMNLVEDIPYFLDEPMADPSQIPTYLVSRAARENVTVALSGDGGDELFGGYNRHVYGAPMIRRLSGWPWLLRAPVGASVLGLSSRSRAGLLRLGKSLNLIEQDQRLADEKLLKLAKLLKQRDSVAMYRSLMSVSQEPRNLVLNSEARQDYMEQMLELPGSLEEKMMLIDQLGYLPDDLLAKVDRASMAVSLEVRVPILDHRVVEKAAMLPLSMKIRGNVGKWALKELLYRYVPRELVDRPKMGFTVPVEKWLRQDLNPWASDLLSKSNVESSGLLNAKSVAQVWQKFQAGETGSVLEIWSLLMFQAWYAKWVS